MDNNTEKVMTVYCVFEHYGEGGCDVCPAMLVEIYTDEQEAKKHAKQYGCYYTPKELIVKYTGSIIP